MMSNPEDHARSGDAASASPAAQEGYDHETVEGRKAAFTAWSNRKKRELGFFAGLRLSRTNTQGWSFARHWPHLLCWDWSVWVSPYRKGYDVRRFGISLPAPICKQAHLDLWLFRVSLHWQNYEFMSALGPHGADAPSIHPTTILCRSRDCAPVTRAQTADAEPGIASNPKSEGQDDG